MNIFKQLTACALAATLGWVAQAGAQTKSLIKIENFGYNPSDLTMHLYVPDSLQEKAPLLLAVHYCHGTGPEFFRGSRYAYMADLYGYIVVYPTANSSDMCFDVATPEALTRDGGSDPVSIMSMIDYTRDNYTIDPERIFVTGVSSGGMMTNVMMGLYPDVFKAGSAFAGVPFGCFALPNGTWNSECAAGRITHTAEEWGDIVRNAYPEYDGPRPKFQFWHGTNDEILNYHNFGEAIKQWTNVQGISAVPTEVEQRPNGITVTRYGGKGDDALVEAISMEGIPHNLPVDYAGAVHYFGLDQVGNSSSSTSSSVSSKFSSSSSSSLSSALSSSSSSSSVASQGDCVDLCKWYQDAPRPLCKNQSAGWGYENNQSCIGATTCMSQSGDGGMINSCGEQSSSSVFSSSHSAVVSSSLPASSSTPSSSSVPSSVAMSSSSSSALSSQPASSSAGYSSSEVSSSEASSSSSANLGEHYCNWYGSPKPLCQNQSNGWGYENQQSCIGATTCEGQTGNGGIVGGSVSSSSSSVADVSGVCNWYGRDYPMCQTTKAGWGWENNASCISRSTCASQ